MIKMCYSSKRIVETNNRKKLKKFFKKVSVELISKSKISLEKKTEKEKVNFFPKFKKIKKRKFFEKKR